MYFVGLLNSIFVAFADHKVFINVFHLLLGLYLEVEVCLGDCW